jgi:chromate reductase
MAGALMNHAPGSLDLEIIEIDELPHYNQDLEEDPPAAWTGFRERLKKFDSVLLVTPEHNRAVPGVLKNAWNGKPGAVVSVSPGAIGGFARTTISGNHWYS